MRFKASMAAVAGFALLLCPAAAPARAEPGAFKQLDLELIQALKAPPGKQALELFGSADQHLVAINKTRAAQPKNATDLDVTVRASLIDSMRDVVALDLNRSTLESVRAQVRSLDLVRSLWDAAGVRQADKTPELDALVTALYERLVATGAQDRNAPLTYGVPDGEALIYRVFVLGSDRRLSSFELTGDRTRRKATWRETRLPARASALMSKAGSLIGLPNAKTAFSAASYPYVLAVGGPLALDANLETKIRARLDKIAEQQGVVPLMLETEQRAEPFTLIPSIAAESDVLAGLGGASAVLMHRASGAELGRWNVQSLRDLDKVAAAAGEIATEVTGDLGRTAPATGEAAPQLSALVAQPKPVKATKTLVSPVIPVDAAPVGGGSTVRLKPSMPLRQRAVLPESDWGQYAPAQAGKEDQKDETLFWLRTGQVETYVPPKPAPASLDETEPGEAKPGKSKAASGKAGEAKSGETSKPLTGPIGDVIRKWTGDKSKKAE